MTDIEQARELLAAEYAMAGSTKRADKIIAGFDCATWTEHARNPARPPFPIPFDDKSRLP